RAAVLEDAQVDRGHLQIGVHLLADAHEVAVALQVQHAGFQAAVCHRVGLRVVGGRAVEPGRSPPGPRGSTAHRGSATITRRARPDPGPTSAPPFAPTRAPETRRAELVELLALVHPGPLPPHSDSVNPR